MGYGHWVAKQPSGWRQSYLCYSYSTPCDSYLFRCFRKRCQHAIPSDEGKILYSRYIGLIPKDFNLSNVGLVCNLCKERDAASNIMPITFRPRQGGSELDQYEKDLQDWSPGTERFSPDQSCAELKIIKNINPFYNLYTTNVSLGWYS